MSRGHAARSGARTDGHNKGGEVPVKLRAICVALVAAAGAPGCGDDNENVDGGTTPPAGSSLVETNLVGSQAGAAHQDPNLINAWGLAFGPTGTAWVAANGTGTTRLYDANGVA